MTATKKALTRGSRASFYRDGHELVSACDIPAAGAFVVRHLPPGQYVAKDMCGGEQAFAVGVTDEYVTLLDGDVVGVTGAPGVSGRREVESLNVGKGGGAYGVPGQVAAGENVTGPLRLSDGETPHEVHPDIIAAARPRERPKDPGSEERVPGQAGAALVQDAPIRSVAEMMRTAKARNALAEDDRIEAEIAAEDAGVPVPAAVKPADVGPAPLEPTTLRDGEGASATSSATPIEGRVEGDAQPLLGQLPEAA